MRGNVCARCGYASSSGSDGLEEYWRRRSVDARAVVGDGWWVVGGGFWVGIRARANGDGW